MCLNLIENNYFDFHNALLRAGPGKFVQILRSSFFFFLQLARRRKEGIYSGAPPCSVCKYCLFTEKFTPNWLFTEPITLTTVRRQTWHRRDAAALHNFTTMQQIQHLHSDTKPDKTPSHFTRSDRSVKSDLRV